MQELSMDFSPDESIQTLLRLASERPKPDGGTLSRRAIQRVRCFDIVRNRSSAKSHADSTAGQTSQIEGEASEN